jgi:hypothetical protein
MKKKLEELGISYDGPAPLPEASEDAPPLPTKPIIGRLTDERIRKLDSIGFAWSLRDDWQKHYKELKEYKRKHGHCNVPARYKENRRLGIWVSAQRQQYKILKAPEGPRRSTPLTQERIDLLNEVGFVWSVRSRAGLGVGWDQRLQELRSYKALHGDCLVPSRYSPNPGECCQSKSTTFVRKGSLSKCS